MKRFIENLQKSDLWGAVKTIILVFVCCTATFLYLLHSDISQAPTFIYSQF